MAREPRRPRHREKVVRGLKHEDSAMLTGLQLYHNFVRPHLGLDGRTPGEAAEISIRGDKWKALIRAAAKADASQVTNFPENFRSR